MLTNTTMANAETVQVGDVLDTLGGPQTVVGIEPYGGTRIPCCVGARIATLADRSRVTLVGVVRVVKGGR